MSAQTQRYVIWLFSDGKPGHENQSQGLVSALSELIPLELVKLAPVSFWSVLSSLVVRRNNSLDPLPRPDIVVGAGHATHRSLLLAKWLYGARSIVLMKPSLPVSLFDLCLVPEHDRVTPRDNVIQTVGVLNRITRSGPKQLNQGVILVGGPSRHYGWDEDRLVAQLKTILATTPDIKWLVSDSRRTPADTSMRIARLEYENLVFQSCQTVKPDWLPQVLAESQYGWVTEDSVSMIYEALTAQVAVGLLQVPRIKSSRVSRGVESLLEKNYVVHFDDWKNNPALLKPVGMENEAVRCAKEVIRRCRLES